MIFSRDFASHGSGIVESSVPAAAGLEMPPTACSSGDSLIPRSEEMRIAVEFRLRRREILPNMMKIFGGHHLAIIFTCQLAPYPNPKSL
ncbi:MAG: hypothetical protein V4584_04645 [Verrucomicrobiota bacterium]